MITKVIFVVALIMPNGKHTTMIARRPSQAASLLVLFS